LTASGNLCSACASNCKTCSIGATCDICNKGYYKSGTECKACYDVAKCTCANNASLIDCTPDDLWGKYFVGTTLTSTN
jgi:hypothetical protein